MTNRSRVWNADAQAKSDVDDPVETKRVQDHARNELAAAWLQAEKLHPILAAYRQDKALERVDLYGISFENDDAMRNVMLHLLPTMGNIMEAKRWLGSGKLDPLTLAPVVELTRHNMFVPRGSVRDAVVMDLVADAGPSSALMIITLALTLALLIPTGGASAVIAMGLLALDLYSAGKQFIHYGQQQALSGTDLDRARSLSDEDPSLTGVVISLISIGLSGAQLISVFRQVQALRNLAAAGRDTEAAVKALNKVGEDLGAGDLGTQAANSGRRARSGASTAADKPPTPDAPTSTAKKPATTDEPTPKPGEQPRPKPDEPTTTPKADEHTPGTQRPSGEIHAPAPLIEELALGYGSRAEVVKAVKDALEGIRGAMPRSWQLVKDALQANGGEANAKILGLVDKYMRAMRNPKHWAEVMGDAWEIARKMPNPDMREALLQLAKQAAGRSPGDTEEGARGRRVLQAIRRVREAADRPVLQGQGARRADPPHPGPCARQGVRCRNERELPPAPRSSRRRGHGVDSGRQDQHGQADRVRHAQSLGRQHHLPGGRDADAHRRLRLALDV